MNVKPYKFKSNKVNKYCYDNQLIVNSQNLHDPEAKLGYRTNSAKPQMDEVSKYLTKTRNAIDCGARWGSFSLACQHLGFEHVTLIEIREMHFKGISHNVDLSKATAYNCAALDKCGYVDKRGKTTILKDGDIPAISIDSLNLTDVDFIKIDVDGPDRLVLKGALETIKKYKPVIYIEQDDHQRKYEEKYGIREELDVVWSELLKDYKVIDAITEPDNKILVSK